ncbi:hypothetical protein D9O40_20470 [Clostridium autoethanogenum]|uniref:Uncharacterized protein n=1 Tax=Clostridium autoethanogenum TaxID=84023 RepID=A0A3M0S3S7_9CLOT|nr:hypothetical protein [Clostridium autoethanogenum]RMC92304.1 hypothetical protein D9O40_20470 [Clostridium autoethanogenum]
MNKIKNTISIGNALNEISISYYGCYKEWDIIWMHDILNATEMPFEGIMFSGSQNCTNVLKNIYGDYMKLSPLDQRGNRYDLIKLDFGDFIPSIIKKGNE